MNGILIVRHAESEWNAAGRWQGHADVPLSKRGREHSAEAGKCLSGFQAIVCSDLRRAVQSAEIIAAEAGISRIRKEPRLRERDAGAWEGLTREEIERGWPGYLQNGMRPGGYEMEEHLLKRVDSALADVIAGEYSEAAAAKQYVLIISHGGVIHSLKIRSGLSASRIPNLAGHWLAINNGIAKLAKSEALGDAERYSANAIEAALNPQK